MKPFSFVALLAVALVLASNVAAQSSQFPITIDATALTRQQLDIANRATSDAQFFDTQNIYHLQLTPGVYAIQMQNGLANLGDFTVNTNGTVSFDESLNSVFSGSGSSTLTIQAYLVAIDARDITPQPLNLLGLPISFDSPTIQQLQLAPGPYVLQMQEGNTVGIFTLNPDRTVTFDPSLSGTFSVNDRNILVVHGLPITIDATALVEQQLDILSVTPLFDSRTVQQLRLVPGPYVAQLESGNVNDGVFSVKPDGTVDFDSSLDSVFAGRNGKTLYIFNGPNGGLCPGVSGGDTVVALAAGWSVQPTPCMAPTAPPQPTPPPPMPLLAPRQRLVPSGDSPGIRATPSGGDPVLADGDFLVQRTDVQLAGFGPHYEFHRTYRSRVAFKGPLGPSWDHSYDKRILGFRGDPDKFDYIRPFISSASNGQDNNPASDPRAGFDYQDGELNVIHFGLSHSEGSYSDPPFKAHYASAQGVPLTLELDIPSNDYTKQTFTIRDADGTALIFDALGFLQNISDPAGNRLTFQWFLLSNPNQYGDWSYHGPPKRLVAVTDASRTVHYLYDGLERIKCVTVGSDCGTATSRPNDVLVYFDYNQNGMSQNGQYPDGELQTVSRGSSTTQSERYVYEEYSASSDLHWGGGLISNLDCIQSAGLFDACHQLYDDQDLSPGVANATYLNAGVGQKTIDWCRSVKCSTTCKDQTCNSHECSHYVDDPTQHDPDPICMSDSQCAPDCVTNCTLRFQCRTDLSSQPGGKTNQPFWAFGRQADLNHNMIEVHDEKDVLVVSNNYGHIPWNINFDRVVTQFLGPATASGDRNQLDFEYHDLEMEADGLPRHPDFSGNPASAPYWPGPYSTPDPQHVVAFGAFQPRNLCPHSTQASANGYSFWTYGTPDGSDLQLSDLAFHAVVLRDAHNRLHVQYYDYSYNLVREVTIGDNGAQERSDYVYFRPSGLLRGAQDASGIRTCYERTPDFGQPTQVTVIPASGYAGATDPQISLYSYDSAQQITDATTDPAGNPAKTHYSRDSLERIIAVDQDVLPGQTDHTALSYDGDMSSSVGVREIPVFVTHGSTVYKYLNLDSNMGGPKDIILDATGPMPKHQYTLYDRFGRISETGERLIESPATDGLAIRYNYNDANQLSSIKHRLSSNLAFGSEVLLSYRSSQDLKLDSIVEPLRSTTYNYSGRYPSQVDYVSGSAQPGGPAAPPTQSTCYHYSPDGRLEDVLLPEGNQIHYSYDFRDRLLSVTKGYSGSPGTTWGPGCTAIIPTPPNGDPGVTEAGGTTFGPGGFVISRRDGDRKRQITTDGFGRIIQSSGTNPDKVNVADEQWGYDSRGYVLWHASFAAGAAMPANPYQRPTSKTLNLIALIEYEYDLIGRIRKEHRWVLHASGADESYDTIVDYDDQNNVVAVQDRGVVTTSTFDGLGRLISRVAQADGTTISINRSIDSATLVEQELVTTDTNQAQKSIRRYQYDTRHHLIGVLDENTNRTLYSAHYDDNGQTGNLKTSEKLGEGVITRDYDNFDRLVHINKQLTTTSSVDEYLGWDRNNRPTSYTDGEQHLWTTVFTGFDQPLTLTDPLQRTARTYYQLGWIHPSGTTEGNGRESCYRYDYDFRLQYVYSVVSGCADTGGILGPATPLVERKRITYYDDGAVAEVIATNARGDTRPAPARVTYQYDSIGRKTEEDVTGNDPHLTSYLVALSYPEQGRATTMQLSGNPSSGSGAILWTAVTRHHDAFNRLKALDANGQQNIAVYDYGKGFGGPLSLTYANGAKTKYTYDDRFRQVGMDVQFSGNSGQPILAASLHEAFGSDSIVHMRVRQIGSGPPVTDVFQVDGDNRVVAENLLLRNLPILPGEVDNQAVAPYMQSGNVWQGYAIDNIGNWKEVTTADGMTKYTVDAASRLTAVGPDNVSRDDRDNLEKVASGSTAFAFDPFTDEVTNAMNGAISTTYAYDSIGRRSAEIAPDGTSSVFLWEGDHIIAHGDPTNLTIDIPGDDIDSHIVSIDGAGTGKARYYHQAQDQSVLAVTDNDGLVEGYSYSAFGETKFWSANGNATTRSGFGNRFNFQGQVFDPLTATYSMRAREYKPQWGRFLSPDPSSVGAGPSLYSFTGARPLSARDPLGLTLAVFCADSLCGTGFGGYPIFAGAGFVDAVGSQGGSNGWGSRESNNERGGGINLGQFNPTQVAGWEGRSPVDVFISSTILLGGEWIQETVHGASQFVIDGITYAVDTGTTVTRSWIPSPLLEAARYVADLAVKWARDSRWEETVVHIGPESEQHRRESAIKRQQAQIGLGSPPIASFHRPSAYEMTMAEVRKGIGVISLAAGAAAGTGAAGGGASLPELNISASQYPELAENISNALQAGHPDVLTYGGDSAANREAALEGIPNIRGLSRDEYPFASAIEGGGGSWVGHIPGWQQSAQGGLISNFLRSNNILPGMKYRVRVVP